MALDSIAHYISVPFAEHGRGLNGWDCWGFLRWFYREQFGIELPSYAETYQTTTDAEEISAMIMGEARQDWREIPMGEAQWGDALLIRMRGRPMHVGVALDPPQFLHCVDGLGTVIERWDRPQWERRVVGWYRHHSR